MKQLKKYLVVLPLVLMFMLQALPVAVEAENKNTTSVEEEHTEPIDLKLPETITFWATCKFPDKSDDLDIKYPVQPRLSDAKIEKKFTIKYDKVEGDDAQTKANQEGALAKKKEELAKEARKAYYQSNAEYMVENYIPEYLKKKIAGSFKVKDGWELNYDGAENAWAVVLTVELKSVRNKNTFRIRAIDIRNKNVIVEQDMEMKDVASSLNDAEVAFRELYERNKLKGMTYVKAERNKDLTASDLYYDSKVTPLTVLHILKGRAPLGEVVPLGVLPRNAEEATILVKEHKVIQGRIRQLATRGYQFDKIVYDDGYRRNPLVREYYDMEGNKVIIEDSLPVLYIYYVPGTPAAANKKVEAAKAEDIQPSVNPPVTAELQAPAPAVLGAVTANNPDPNENPNEAHLPATGEQDHIVLLLSSIGLMIVGLVLSKKR